MHMVSVLVCSLWLVAKGQDEEWIDPYDMLNYDASTKTMKNPAEPKNYEYVPTKRRDHIQDSNQIGIAECNIKVQGLQREIAAISQQPSCHPVFKRFITKLLKEIQRVGLPSDSASEVYYDAKVKLSHQAMSEIKTLLDGIESWRTGALDDALSQILVDLKPHDYEAWRWHFEDTFGVEVFTVIQMLVCVLIIVAIICSEVWSVISWFVQFRRLFAICFFISIGWNWLYLYKIAFAEHQNNFVKMEGFNEKCSGLRKIDWSDNLKEWYRSTWTLQDDPCKKYYEVVYVNPILIVPPTKAISVTITTFITEPLKHIGQGISDFLRALLKDLPVTLQIPVLLTIVLSILVFLYGIVQAAFQHGILRPLTGHRRDPPPPVLGQQQPEPQLQPAQLRDRLAEGDAPQPAPHPAPVQRNNLWQRRPNRVRMEPETVYAENLGRSADQLFSDDDVDSQTLESISEAELTEGFSNSVESDPTTGQEVQKEMEGATASSIVRDLQVKTSQARANDSQTKVKAKKDGISADSHLSDNQARTTNEGQPSLTAQGNDAQVHEALIKSSIVTGQHIDTIGLPVQETAPTSQE
ncbi:chloride channel CLIC-like protein 1 [Osmerus eperlanus]|uniref:chloride channel CLIC-like protein 1 n=1 Tax=Osmerus eperlanus TaxID=29151 RepID=UPI002E13C187